jgi:hypothetical protein
MAWAPECGGSSAGAAGCELPWSETRDPALGTGAGGIEEADPFYVWAYDTCSTLGGASRDWQGRARRRLEASQSFQIAREMWEGAIARDQGSPTGYLADDLTLASSTPVAAAKVGVLEAWAAECSEGQRSMLHMSPHLFGLYLAAVGSPAVTVSGSLVVTALGNIVVTDAGYTGRGPISQPDDGKEWAYITPLVQIRLDAVEILPGSLNEARNLAAAVNRRTNDVTVWAQRLAAYQLDPCCRFGVGTDVTRPTTPTPAS